MRNQGHILFTENAFECLMTEYILLSMILLLQNSNLILFYSKFIFLISWLIVFFKQKLLVLKLGCYTINIRYLNLNIKVKQNFINKELQTDHIFSFILLFQNLFIQISIKNLQ